MIFKPVTVVRFHRSRPHKLRSNDAPQRRFRSLTTMIFEKLRRRKIGALYLGTVSIAPKSTLNMLEQYRVLSKFDPVEIIEQEVRGIFQLPPITEAKDPRKSDIGIDVLVSDFRLGNLYGVNLSSLAFPLFWRPRIEMRARLFSLSNMETVSEFSAIAIMPLSVFARRALHPAVLLRIRPKATQNDLIRLTQEASIAVLEKIQKWSA